MDFVKTPITYNEDSLVLTRNLTDIIAMLDNFVEMVVFTPRGNFLADPDFGFEYWNHEYSNVDNYAFNSGQNGSYSGGLSNEITKQECQNSIKRSLEIYETILKHADVSIELSSVDDSSREEKSILSKRKVIVNVTGILDDGLGTFVPYKKTVSFYMEPTVKTI